MEIHAASFGSELKMYLAVEKHKIIVKYCQFNTIIINGCKIDAIFLQEYKQNLLNFRHHFFFGVPYLKALRFSIILQIKH
jgi:hypothetical protein